MERLLSRFESGNLYDSLPAALDAELFTQLLSGGSFKLERIVSTGHVTPDGEWYDQDQAEWVVVLKGSASLRFKSESTPRTLREGDYLLIPPHLRHRVEATDPDQPTVWLAIHFEGT